MPSKLVIDIDSLTPEKGKYYAGIILGIAGFEDGDTPDVSTFDPKTAFGQPAASGIVDVRAPHLEIPAPPPPPPPPPAPVVNEIAPNGAGASSVLAVSTDISGIPWDGRIHASSKAQNADKTWRLKRGVDAKEVEKVVAELKRTMAAPARGPQLVQAAAPPLPPPPPPPPAPVQAAAPPPPPPPPAATGDDATRKMYVELIGRSGGAVGAGKITQDQVKKCLEALGMESMQALGHRLDLVAAACSLIDGVIAGASA